MGLDKLIYDRTENDVKSKLPKATYTESDIRRIDSYMIRLSDHFDLDLPRLLEDDESLPVISYTLIQRMVNNANAIRAAANLTDIPAAKLRNRWGYERANEVERILYDAYRQVVQMVDVEVTGEDVTDVSGISKTAYGYPLYVQVRANQGYMLPTSITVEIGGEELEAANYTYTESSGMIFIPPQYVIGEVLITVNAGEASIYTLFLQEINCDVTATDRETATRVYDGDFIYTGHHIDWSAVPHTGYVIVGASSGSVVVNDDVTIRVIATANVYILSIRATHCQVAVSVYRESIGRLQPLYDGDIIYQGDVLFWTAVADEGYLIWGPSSGTKDVTGHTTIAVVATDASTLQTPYLRFIGLNTVKVEWDDTRTTDFLIYDGDTLLGSADAITGEFTPAN